MTCCRSAVVTDTHWLPVDNLSFDAGFLFLFLPADDTLRSYSQCYSTATDNICGTAELKTVC